MDDRFDAAASQLMVAIDALEAAGAELIEAPRAEGWLKGTIETLREDAESALSRAQALGWRGAAA